MPRYYFVIRSGDRELGDDDGTLLPRDAAAWDYALRIIGELKESGNYDDPGLQMIVKEEGGRQVFVIPFSEAGSFHWPDIWEAPCEERRFWPPSLAENQIRTLPKIRFGIDARSDAVSSRRAGFRAYWRWRSRNRVGRTARAHLAR